MSSYKTIKKRNVIVSIALHLVLSLGAGVYLETIPPSVKMGDKTLSYIHSYLYQSQKQNHQAREKQQKTAIAAKPLAKKGVKQTQEVSKVSAAKSSPPAIAQSSPAASAGNGEKTKTLLALLHTAIQNKQQYPASAMQMGRQGRIKLGFTLYPDGAITGLHLIKSSGTASLDAAALAAVNLAAPFAKIEEYLQSPGEFVIDVVFALDEGSE